MCAKQTRGTHFRKTLPYRFEIYLKLGIGSGRRLDISGLIFFKKFRGTQVEKHCSAQSHNSDLDADYVRVSYAITLANVAPKVSINLLSFVCFSSDEIVFANK